MRRRPGRLASLAVSLTLTASALQHSRPARLALAFTLLTRSASALHHAQRPRVLLVDCHDSYTHNVASWLHDAGATPEVVAADDAAFEEQLNKDAAALLRKYDALVLSPGPGHPAHVPATLHQCLRHADDMPVLGVCLGHQFLALSEGGAVKRLEKPQHGLVSRVAHTGSRLFKGMEQGFEATRYHSLTVDENSLANSNLRITARGLREGDVLAVEHVHKPRYGVQFHPESVATPRGRSIAANFLGVVRERSRRRPAVPSIQKHVPTPTSSFVTRATRLGVHGVDAAAVHRSLFAEDGFWLDGRNASVLGDAGGPFGAVLTHRTSLRGGITHRNGEVLRGDVLDHVQLELATMAHDIVVDETGSQVNLPFAFRLGLVGYLGYEVRRETADYPGETSEKSAPEPDAAFIRCGRAVVIHDNCVWILELQQRGTDYDGAWRLKAEAAVRAAKPTPKKFVRREISLRPQMSKRAYAKRVARARAAIDAGDSYEVCLTTTFGAELDHVGDPLTWYEALRSKNPAPHAAYLKLNDVAILCSSPERFLSIDATTRRVEARPFKGTAARYDDATQDLRSALTLQNCIKSNAENLMIADLLRNDLSRSCVLGSVNVTELCALESFATVHQLVTTVEGTASTSTVDVVRNAFPPGSMTGAPKRRTCEILDDLEGRARGCYAGALGFFGFDGSADLNVVIRTAVLSGLNSKPRLDVAAGGALTALSDTEEEWNEVVLKAKAVADALVEGGVREEALVDDAVVAAR